MGKISMLRTRVQMLGHQPAKQGGWGAGHRGSAASRGYGNDWRKLRDLVMLRDCGICQVCARLGTVSAADAVDHIVPKAEGGTDARTNLQAICDPCHKIKTAAESARAPGLASILTSTRRQNA